MIGSRNGAGERDVAFVGEATTDEPLADDEAESGVESLVGRLGSVRA